jgi:hypothetical protein
MVKHHLRRQRGTHSYNDAVFLVEKAVLKGFAADETLCKAFYQNEDFATKMLEDTVNALERGILPPAPPSEDLPPVPIARHGAFCGPQCYCLKYQDVPLALKPEDVAGFKKDIWEDDFRARSRTAAASVVRSVGAARAAADARLAAVCMPCTT